MKALRIFMAVIALCLPLASQASPQKYEYKVIEVAQGVTVFASRMEELLNRMAQDGWEVTMISSQNQWVVFRRPK